MQAREFKEYISIKHLDNLEALSALFYDHAFGRHYHEGYAIGVILEGSETYQCGKKINIAPKGSIVVVNPGEIHNGHASDKKTGWRYFMIYPELSLVEKALAQMELRQDRLPVFKDSVVFDPALRKGLEDFMTACTLSDSKLSLESHFLSLLHILIKNHANFAETPVTVRPASRKTQKIIELIHGRFAENLSLDSLAVEVGLSAYALLRLFKKQTGISPYLLQAALRIKQAKKQLRSGINPAQTAASCGFSDQSHMTRQFRRWMGITPGDYLQTLKSPRRRNR